MRSPGGMFLEEVDPRDLDAQFFGISTAEAVAMDPQQRQLLEVVYEGLENAGITLEYLRGREFGCFVGSYASGTVSCARYLLNLLSAILDHSDNLARDPEEKPSAFTVGIGRAMLSNRISHFLDVHGPSMTIDTACSGSLVAVDVACHYLRTRQVQGAIVAGCNMFLNPEHSMDASMAGAISNTGRCHTFDVKADGYVKAEAANAVILKRLDDALRDRDPIRAVIRGSACNSDGRTVGIASPSSAAQAKAIRNAYANAGISDFSTTCKLTSNHQDSVTSTKIWKAYLECHGTGTPAGDPIEIKSNLGHSEPAAGISGLLKAILALEKGAIPGNPTFDIPNPSINFKEHKVQVPKQVIPWPENAFRRACVNSFGYGGSNAVVVLDDAREYLETPIPTFCFSSNTQEDVFSVEETSQRPYLLVISANDKNSLLAYQEKLYQHLIDPRTNLTLRDLSYTLSEKRTRHFHRSYVISSTVSLGKSDFVYSSPRSHPPRISFIFTGQGAQWPQMEELMLPRRPELIRLPEFSQPLLTALQLAILEIFDQWNIRPQNVVGHSSGEIAAAVSAGLISPREAIKIAHYRGKTVPRADKPAAGMLAVGLGHDEIYGYLSKFRDSVEVACINSPKNTTLSGTLASLEQIQTHLQSDHHFARLLQVDLPYHSKGMLEIAAQYRKHLERSRNALSARTQSPAFFSSVTGSRLEGKCDPDYWERNMVSPVLFHHALQRLICEEGADMLIEIGPSNALAGPISQILQTLPIQEPAIEYHSSLKRGSDGAACLLDVAGRVYLAGGAVRIAEVNRDITTNGLPSTVVDLPNYQWNHSIKYWQESEASKDWRFRTFPPHDLLGSKVLVTDSERMPMLPQDDRHNIKSVPDTKDEQNITLLSPTHLFDRSLSASLEANRFRNILQLFDLHATHTIRRSACCALVKPDGDDTTDNRSKRASLINLSDDTSLGAPIRAKLLENGWNVVETSLYSFQPRHGDVVVVVDDGCALARQNLDESRWNALRKFFLECDTILWVTKGSQLQSDNPHNALIFGFARTIRSEDPSLKFMVLDLESWTRGTSIETIHSVLHYLQSSWSKTQSDVEFAESEGIIYVNRVLPNASMNKAESDYIQGAGGQEPRLFDSQSCVRIDVAVAMGIVPGDLSRLGLEGAGIVRRIGNKVTSLSIGQRVAVYRRGCFANRVQSPIQGVHALPDSMSFEDAAKLPCVWLVVLYCLMDVCQVRSGQIFATVGTQEKRDFLIKHHGIHPHRIYDSRSTSFASQIMIATDTKGIDVILNSLSGDLLVESWRCIADGGTMVDISKTDMVERRSLPMEPFSRNASYRAVDMSYRNISRATTASLLSRLFRMIAEGDIEPECPATSFSFNDIPAAFRYMRQGIHIGKILISDGNKTDVKVKIRQAAPQLQLSKDVSYIIIGGLKGLCGSLAVYLARIGARHLVMLSRSGYDDSKSQAAIANLDSLGCSVQLVKGDVTDLEAVKRMFQTAVKPVGGVIQGAMVLRDKMFPSMSLQDFNDAVQPKVQGSWNLHLASLEFGGRLEFFTMLASISGVVGQKGQANYAAGNTFQDSLAKHRQNLGLPACSIDLGVVGDVGYISERKDLAERLDTTVWTEIDEQLLHKILRLSLLQQIGPPHERAEEPQMITGIPVPQHDDSPLLRDPRFSGLHCGLPNDHKAENHGSLKDAEAFFALLKSQSNKSTKLLGTVEIINRAITRILNLSQPLEPNKSLSGYGIDSLAAVEMRNWFRLELNLEVTTLEINNAQSLTSLCETILMKSESN
ncbi:MAG: hypothetical protein Q9225_003986 [Loekoesia sp. 1 TL-2023]